MKTIVLGYPASERDVRLVQESAPESHVIASEQSNIARDLFLADFFCGHAKVPVDWAAIVAAGRLRWIQSSAAGLDHCLVSPVVNSSIVVSGASGLFADQVAEQTLALVYGLMRGLPQFFRAQQNRTFERLPVDDLRLKDVAVLGCGGNGLRIAHLLAPAVRSLVATDLFPDSVQTQGKFVVVDASKTRHVVGQCDLVICTLPLNSATHGLLNREMLSGIRDGGYFVNTGRGQLVDETALIELLRSGHLRGAGLDVFANEPPDATSPLWSLDNVIMTPHVGAQGATRYSDVTALFCENLRRFAAGDDLINQVDKSLGLPLPKHRLSSQWRSESWASV